MLEEFTFYVMNCDGRSKFLVVSLFLVFFCGSVFSASIGALPGITDFGEIERGETIERSIYVTSADVRNNFTVDPSTGSDGDADLFAETFPGRFEVSEQPFEDWITMEEKTIDPLTQRTVELEGGGRANINGEFTFRMEVPDDAEPGIRRGLINLNPELSTNGSEGAGAQLIGTTQISYSFEIPGEADRQINVQDVRAFRQGEDSAAVEVLLRNEGTVTASTENFEVDILDSRRNREATVSVSGIILEPGESQWVDGFWNEETQIEEGTYQIDGSVNYMTGSATASGSFSLPGIDRIEVRPEDSPGSDEETGDGVPVWFVIIVLTILGVLMWGFEIEPFWIIAIVGTLGISSFIIISGLPNFLLAILLGVIGIVVYGGI
jgi:hypothetical protein